MKPIALLSDYTMMDLYRGTWEPSSYGIENTDFRSLYFVVDTLDRGPNNITPLEYLVRKYRGETYNEEEGEYDYYVLPDQIKFMENK